MSNVKTSPTLTAGINSIDPQSGKLRLMLLAILTIIIWTALALISSLANPIRTAQVFGSNVIQEKSGTLASSLIGEILGSYFSLYTLSYLLLFFLAIIFSFFFTRFIVKKVFQINDPKPVSQLIKYSTFSIPAYPEFDTQEQNFAKSADHKLLTSIGGPAYLNIGSDEIGFVTSRESGIDILVPEQAEPAAFFLEHGTKLESLLHRRKKQALIKAHSHLIDGRSVEFHSVRITYSLDIAVLERENENFDKLRYEVAAFTQSANWEMLIENLIQSEFGSMVSGYSGAEILDIIGPIASQSATNDLAPKQHSDKTHNVRKHGRPYDFKRNLPTQSNGGTILRNRRRSIQPEMHAEVEPIEVEEIKEPEPITIETLSKRLSKLVNTLFSEQVININIEEIGKVSFHGVH